MSCYCNLLQGERYIQSFRREKCKVSENSGDLGTYAASNINGS